jgi:hypothetical protein
VIINVPLVVSICAGFSVLAFLSSLAVWLYSRRAIRNARTRCDEGLRQLRQDLELKNRGLFTELSQLVETERDTRENAIRDLAKTCLENDEIAAECVGEIENLFDLKLAEVVCEITRKRDTRGRFIKQRLRGTQGVNRHPYNRRGRLHRTREGVNGSHREIS